VEKSGPIMPGVPSSDNMMCGSADTALTALRGNHPARVDSKGRLKIPNGFLSLLRAHFGLDLFATSVTGEFVRLYPMPVWLEVERRLAAVPSTSPAKNRFLDRVNFFGQVVTIDRQGRVLLPQILRESATMTGDVSVLGLQNHLAVWNQNRLKERLFKREPFTDEDGRVLAEYGI
jgi:MraZ protein